MAHSNIADISFCECVDSKYVKPARMCYSENGIKKQWDFIKSLDSVAILLYHKDKDSLLFVKQFRPAVFVQNGQNLASGYTYELCAGLMDKDKSIEQIAKEEVLEECGYSVNALEPIATFATSVGTSGATQHLFFAEIDEGKKLNAGGGIDGEVIELVFVKVGELEAFLHDESKIKTPGLGFGVMWFLRYKWRAK